MASDGQMDGHAHHQSDSPPESGNAADCGHEGCLNDCNSVAGVKSEAVKVSITRGVDSDDLEAIAVEIRSATPRLLTLNSTGPPVGFVRQSPDTPIHRHDRLVI